jgi:signal transduction histidine kinase/CheY-like chemotaxis protein
LWETIRSGKVWHGELVNKRRDDSLYIEEMTVTPVRGEDGEISHYIAIKQDATERKELEEQLRQAQKMEAIGQLAGGVAHDFNNMLTVIRGHTELLLMQPDRVNGSTADSLGQVVAAADRASNLTRQLLTFSRKQPMQAHPLDLDDVLGNLTKMLKRIIGEDIQFRCSHGAGLPMIHADTGMIEQVLVNLVVNARDAMPDGGQLHVITEKVMIETDRLQGHPERRPGTFVSVTVSDTGTGIAPEHMARIFEPFFTTKEIGKGTGLGLATVYGIVKQHEGWIEVRTKVGAGTSFQVFLPGLQSHEVASAPLEKEAPPEGGTETILLVEDDDAVRSLTRQLLEHFGYSVREANSGREALELWQNALAEIDLLLTDMIMPGGVSGRELAHRLLERRPELKVIYLTGYSDENLAGDTSFMRRTQSLLLQKPCPWNQLLAAVRGCLDS